MLTQEESNSVAQELSDRIRAYKRKRPNLSSQNIAKRFGMSASTFNRIENLDIKTPTFEQIVRVLSGTGHEKDLISYIENNFPLIPKLICNHYVENLGKELPVISEDVRNFITNPQYTKLLCYILCKKKLTRNQLIKEFGNYGLNLTDELIEKNIVKDDGEYLSVSSSYFYVPKLNDVRQILHNLIATSFNAKSENSIDSMNFLTIQLKPINAEKALPIMKEKLSKLYHEFDQLCNDPDFEGNDPVYLGLVSDCISNFSSKPKRGKSL